MRILALDTSTDFCSVALWRDGAVDSRGILAGQRHSTLLLGMVDELLVRHGVRARDLDGIAFGRGPGSFTGLRIACGVAQGLAFGAGLRVVGVCTLLALAQAARAERAVCCIDARMGEIYHAAFRKEGSGWHTVHEPSLCAPAAAPPLPSGAWTGCGSAFAVHADALARRYAGRVAKVAADVFPHAKDIAQLAVPEFEQGRALGPERAVPVYVRNKVALQSDEKRTQK